MSSAHYALRGAAPDKIVERAFETLEIAAEHDATVIQEADEWRQHSGLEDPALEDLTALSFITIDNPDSRDLDQALQIERDGEDYRVRYALADAAYYVRPGTLLFEAALARGTSYYTPLGSAPMLPRSLSEDLVSLGPDATRRAVVFDMRLDDHGQTLNVSIQRARIRSRAKLTYAGVQRYLDSIGPDTTATAATTATATATEAGVRVGVRVGVGAGAGAGAASSDRTSTRDAAKGDATTVAGADTHIATTLTLLREVGEKLSKLARERGVIAYDRREAQISVANDPPRFVASERERLQVEEWNAQISLLCNSEGALLLAALDRHEADDRLSEETPANTAEATPGAKGTTANARAAVPADAGQATGPGTLEPIYRVHAAPLSARLKQLRQVIDDWVTASGLDEQWRWRRSQGLADYLDALPGDPRHRARVRAVQRQVLIRQRASEFSAEPGRHHALATDYYARFSSPMREVVGIFTHLELLAALEGEGVANAALQNAVISSANAAKRRQKALDKAIGLAVISDLLDADLAQDSPPARTGTILGVRAGSQRSAGHLYIGLDDLALDLKVQADDLRRRHGTPYSLDDVSARPQDKSKPVFLLGDTVGVRAVSLDDTQNRYALDVVLKGDSARRERRRARPS